MYMHMYTCFNYVCIYEHGSYVYMYACTYVCTYVCNSVVLV